MHVNYKVIPVDKAPPDGPSETWIPILKVRIIYKHAPSKFFEAVVDSGSPWCLFHATVGEALGMDVASGHEQPLGGIVGGALGKVFFHKVKLVVGGNLIELRAGFSPTLAVAAILGREGFFDNHVVTFNPQSQPPGLEIERFYRA